jgi:hypothetical protein
MIIIEREALLTVLSRAPLLNEYDEEEEYVLVTQPKGVSPPLVQKLRSSTSFDDDCCSLASTSCSSLDDEPRRVRFSEDHQVHVVERLYHNDNLSEHFYSNDDTLRYVSLSSISPVPFAMPFCEFFSSDPNKVFSPSSKFLA